MKIWNIVDEENEYSIEVGTITLLKKQDIFWHHLIRKIDEFFNVKTSKVKIYEDTQLLNKKDWTCYFIPFDAQVQLEKITSKSPLNDIQNYASEQLTYSPFFSELQDIWEQLNEELQLINQKLYKWGISASLKEFEMKKLKDSILFQSINKEITPIEYKKLLLQVALHSSIDKKVLIIIELPELYAEKSKLQILNGLINDAVKKGYHFLIVSENGSWKNVNYVFKDTVINNAILDQMKFKILKELPIYCSDKLYEDSKGLFFKLVDNSITIKSLRDNTGENFGAIVTILYVMMYNLGIEFTHDLSDIEPNLKKFIYSYR